MPPLRIFISYGRDQYAPLAARLAADLTARGYEVWYDQQLQSGRPWARVIQRQLDWLVEDPKTGRFIYLLSTHSTREDSFCLSELQYAIDNHVPIFPVLLETCKIPIEIYPLQRLDMRPCLPVENHKVAYLRLIDTLTEDMQGKVEDRLVQQKIIENQAPEEPQEIPALPDLSYLEEKLRKTPFESPVISRIHKSRWGWGIAIAAIIVAVIGIASQSQRLAAMLWPTTMITPTVSPLPTSTSGPPACAAVGQTWRSPIDGMTLVCVPAGDFLMGSTDADNGAESDEKPQHRVYLDTYWIDQTEVTNSLYKKCVSAGICGSRTAVGGDNYPQVRVDWTDAKTYCEWAGRQLPSEAQWEKAARGTDGRLYPWGNNIPNATLTNVESQVGKTTAVGSYPSGASPYGALDMAGNVWEWVEDWYGEAYYQSQSTWRNPAGPASGIYRVFRGGSWNNTPEHARAAFRYGVSLTNANDGLGFRCAR